jgi:hypothetical protein
MKLSDFFLSTKQMSIIKTKIMIIFGKAKNKNVVWQSSHVQSRKVNASKNIFRRFYWTFTTALVGRKKDTIWIIELYIQSRKE